MWRSAIFTLSIALTPLTEADDVSRALELWAGQGGPWTGYIDIYSADAAAPNRVSLHTRWDGVPDATVVTKIETFSSEQGEMSAVTLNYVDAESGHIVTPYYAGGGQRDYRFALLSVEVTDEHHWTTVIASPDGEEQYEGRPAELRYVRTRKGDVVENTKEVRFLDGSPQEWELRSYIFQRLAQ